MEGAHKHTHAHKTIYICSADLIRRIFIAFWRQHSSICPKSWRGRGAARSRVGVGFYLLLVWREHTVDHDIPAV